MISALKTMAQNKSIKASSTKSDAEPKRSSAQWPPGLFDEITDVLAEIIMTDFQAVTDDMAKSPGGSGHK